MDTAPEFFIDALHDIQFLGVNTLFIPYRNVLGPNGTPVRAVPFTARMATGALIQVHRQVEEYVREHQLLRRWNQETTR